MSLPIILLAFANDRQGAFLRGIAEENKAILEALQPAIDKNRCEVVVIPDATADDIIEAFQRHRGRVRIFHYGGHADGFGMLVSSGDGKVESVHGASFADFLRQQAGLQLVFLNGCSSQGQAEGLLGAQIPNVIATSQAINDEAARNLATLFYQALANGATLSQCFEEAKAGVLMKNNGQTRSLTWEGKDDLPETEAVTPWHWFGSENPHELTDLNLMEQVNKYVAKANLAGALELLMEAADTPAHKEALAVVAMHVKQMETQMATGQSVMGEVNKLTAAVLALTREIADPDPASGSATATAMIAALAQKATIRRPWRTLSCTSEHAANNPDTAALVENWDQYMKSVTVLFSEDGFVTNWNNFGTKDNYTYNSKDGSLKIIAPDGAGGFNTTLWEVRELTGTRMVVYDPVSTIFIEMEPDE